MERRFGRCRCLLVESRSQNRWTTRKVDRHPANQEAVGMVKMLWINRICSHIFSKSTGARSLSTGCWWNTETTCFLDCRKGWDLVSCPPQEIHKLMPLKNPFNGAYLGGGNSNIFGIFTPKIGEDEPNLTSILFQLGWFNHQPDMYLASTINHLFISMIHGGTRHVIPCCSKMISSSLMHINVVIFIFYMFPNETYYNNL